MNPNWQERKLASGDPEVADVLPLILDSFNYMRHRINPSSSILQTTVEDLRALCDTAEFWVVGSPPIACVCLTPEAEALSIGRLAVAPNCQGQGLGTKLMALAERRAREMSLPSLQLHVRVELHENIQYYRQLGFSVSAEGRHPGFEQPTYFTMRKLI